MKRMGFIVRLVAVLFVVTTTVLLALYIFDAVNMDVVRNSLTKVGLLSLLVIAASGLIVTLTGDSGKK